MQDQTQRQVLFGVSLVVLAMAIIGLVDNFVARIAVNYGVWQFHFIRSVIMCGIIYGLAKRFGWSLRPRNMGAVALRSLFLAVAMFVYFGSLGLISVAQAAAGLFSAPIFVLLISVLFLGTRIGIWRILAVGLGFIGVLMILRPMGEAISALTLLPVLGGLFYALNGIAIRRWCGGESTTVLVFYGFAGLGLFGLLGTVFFTVLPLTGEGTFFSRGWVTPDPVFWLWTVVQALGSLVAVVLLTRGYQRVEVSFVTSFEYSFLIFAGFWAYVLTGVTPDLTAAIGIALIILSGVIIALRAR